MLWFLLFGVVLGDQQPVRYSIPQPLNQTAFALRHNLRFVTHVGGYDIYESRAKIHSREDFPREMIPDVPKLQVKRYYRNGRSDPLYPAQFHLHDNPYAVDSHECGVTGKGVRIAIVDDGIEHTHPDLADNYEASLSYDFNGHDADPMPNSYDGHGTSCAGVCCAVQNTVCGRGVAPKASIVGVRLIGGAVYDYEEAQALGLHADKIRIYSCSWGPADSGMDLVGPGRVTQEILRRGYESGRSIYVWAGGNGRQNADMSNYDGYANSPYTMAIGAIDHNGHQAYYSESGANIFAVTPSSGGGKGISTTDLTGHHGYGRGSCTHSFGGTSSAAPLAAGVIALMLEKRPELKNRDIQHIIATHSFKGLRGTDWSRENARGYTHSNRFGFGLLKVPALLAAIDTHIMVPHPPSRYSERGKAQVTVARHFLFVEQVLLTLTVRTHKRGDVAVRLRSRDNTSILAKKRGDSFSGRFTWTFSSLRHWGEELRVGDVWEVDVQGGTLEKSQVDWIGIQ